MSAPTPPPEDVTALILAAGDGIRLGEPKAFLAAAGVTLLERSVAAVQPFAAEVIAGVRADDMDKAASILGDAAIPVAGGANRQETFQILLDRATRPIVLLHEVARPFAPAALFAEVLAAAGEYGAAAASLPASRRDALALADGDFYGEFLPLDRVVRTQTPQAYRREVLISAMQAARKGGLHVSSVVPLCVEAGHPVRLVPGDEGNLKITFAEDWDLACARLGGE